VIVAIDGPAASGKSTVARAVATRLGANYLDTGAMYRAVAAEALHRGVAVDDADALGVLAAAVDITFEHESGQPLPTRVLIGGRDVTTEIRTPAVDTAVSPVSAVPAVRSAMVGVQREVARQGDWVVEGRDIGTVVFPDAKVKVFLTATAAERARRRRIDMERLGIDVDVEEMTRRIEARDLYDSTRAASPLKPAEDAVMLDTTGLTIEQVVERIATLAAGDS
jgi:cytidylate kinase